MSKIEKYDYDYLLNHLVVNKEVEFESMVIHKYKGFEFEKVSPWIFLSGYCAFRHLDHANPCEITGRVAFIEKTARIRESFIENEWISGVRSSDYGSAETSLAWCDMMLYKKGYKLIDNQYNKDLLEKYESDEWLMSEIDSEYNRVYKAG